MIEVKELVDLLKHMRGLTEGNDEISLIAKDKELTVIFEDDFITVKTFVEGIDCKPFDVNVSFKTLYELLRNSVSKYVDFKYAKGLNVELRNSKAVLEERVKLFGSKKKMNTDSYKDRMFSMEVNRLTYILSQVIAHNEASVALIIASMKDGAVFELSGGEYSLEYDVKTDFLKVISLDMEAVRQIYKCIKNLEGYVDVFVKGKDVLFLMQDFEILVSEIEYFERKDAPESTYQTDLVTDDLLEAVRVTSKIAKATFLIFNEPDTMCVCCATNKASYYKKILCESNVPLGMTLKVDSKELFQLVNDVKDDYIVLETTEANERISIKDSKTTMSIRSDIA